MEHKKYSKRTKSTKPRLYSSISIAAHQLKNPISVIKSYVEVLLSEEVGKINDKQREYLNDTTENILKMIEIVKDHLEVSKIEENQFNILLQKTNIITITQEVIKDNKHWVEAHGSKIVFHKPTKNFFVITDASKIREVIEILIINAMKYKPPGKGKIEIWIKKKNNRAVFICRDSGIGILKRDFKNIFRKYYRSEKAAQIDSRGTGLGLYISQAIIEKSKGRIWFTQNETHGVTFYFSLPLAT